MINIRNLNLYPLIVTVPSVSLVAAFNLANATSSSDRFVESLAIGIAAGVTGILGTACGNIVSLGLEKLTGIKSLEAFFFLGALGHLIGLCSGYTVAKNYIDAPASISAPAVPAPNQ